MRLTRGNTRTVMARVSVPHEDVYAWEEGGVAIRASVQPVKAFGRANADLLAAAYGERVLQMKTLYYCGCVVLEAGMGFCVDVPDDAPCDYRAISVDKWKGHQAATLEFIPESRR